LLAPRSTGSGSFEIHLGSGRVKLTGNAAYALMGDVVDGSGALIGEFSQVCAEALRAWERALRDAGVELPPASEETVNGGPPAGLLRRTKT
jgi:hypothetical protein